MASIGLSPVNYSTVSKKASDVPYEIFKDLFHLLISKCNRAKHRKKLFKQVLFLVDSTSITVSKNRLPWYHFMGSNLALNYMFRSHQKRLCHLKWKKQVTISRWFSW